MTVDVHEIPAGDWKYSICGKCGRPLKTRVLLNEPWIHVETLRNECPLGTVALPEKEDA